MQNQQNADPSTVASFGAEWEHYDQAALSPEELRRLFDAYFAIFPWAALPTGAVGFDMGCGSGRWAKQVAPRVGRLTCIDASAEALAVARRAMADLPNVDFRCESVGRSSLAEASQDFGYSLGVLHHVPDTRDAMRACVSLLKPGAPFLVYLYYRFDNRPLWFRGVWKMSEIGRALISRSPNRLKPHLTDAIAGVVYWPLARLARALERLGLSVGSLPLSYYRDTSFYTMRTDSRDRFGTPLEQRFTRKEIQQMMEDAGLRDVAFSPNEPYWVAVGYKV